MVEKIKKLGFLKRAFSTYIDKIIKFPNESFGSNSGLEIIPRPS